MGMEKGTQKGRMKMEVHCLDAGGGQGVCLFVLVCLVRVGDTFLRFYSASRKLSSSDGCDQSLDFGEFS